MASTAVIGIVLFEGNEYRNEKKKEQMMDNILHLIFNIEMAILHA